MIYTAVPKGDSIAIFKADTGAYWTSIYIEPNINIINVQTTPEYINVTYTTQSGCSYLSVYNAKTLAFTRRVDL